METHTLIDNGVLKQHLIDPEICIRCNTCEATCPVNAITHDDNNYVVRADVCNGCMACISPCPRVPSTTGVRCRWAGPTALKSISAGKSCPASLRPTNWLQQAQNPLQR